MWNRILLLSLSLKEDRQAAGEELIMATSWYLIAGSGSEAGSGFQLMGPIITIGRAADNDIVIDDNFSHTRCWKNLPNHA